MTLKLWGINDHTIGTAVDWEVGKAYKNGDLVLHDGAVWQAMMDTTAGQEPGRWYDLPVPHSALGTNPTYVWAPRTGPVPFAGLVFEWVYSNDFFNDYSAATGTANKAGLIHVAWGSANQGDDDILFTRRDRNGRDFSSIFRASMEGAMASSPLLKAQVNNGPLMNIRLVETGGSWQDPGALAHLVWEEVQSTGTWPEISEATWYCDTNFTMTDGDVFRIFVTLNNERYLSAAPKSPLYLSGVHEGANVLAPARLSSMLDVAVPSVYGSMNDLWTDDSNKRPQEAGAQAVDGSSPISKLFNSFLGPIPSGDDNAWTWSLQRALPVFGAQIETPVGATLPIVGSPVEPAYVMSVRWADGEAGPGTIGAVSASSVVGTMTVGQAGRDSNNALHADILADPSKWVFIPTDVVHTWNAAQTTDPDVLNILKRITGNQAMVAYAQEMPAVSVDMRDIFSLLKEFSVEPFKVGTHWRFRDIISGANPLATDTVLADATVVDGYHAGTSNGGQGIYVKFNIDVIAAIKAGLAAAADPVVVIGIEIPAVAPWSDTTHPVDNAFDQTIWKGAVPVEQPKAGKVLGLVQTPEGKANQDVYDVMPRWVDPPAAGGGGGGFSESFAYVANTGHDVAHNLNKAYPQVSVWNETTKKMVTADVVSKDANTITVTVSVDGAHTVVVS